MKLVDSFMFFNEIEIAYLRIKELYDSVDYFVINEATKTHQGQKKQLIFNNDKRLQEFKEKIIYNPIDLDGRFDELMPKYFPDAKIGAKEHEQRIRLFDQIEELSLEDDDIIMISDCDEIPNKYIFQDLKDQSKTNTLIALNQMFFVHYINIYTDKNVTGTVATKYKYLKFINSQCHNMGLQILRRDKDFIPRIENGGWHYSYMGGPISVSQKVVSTYDGNLNSPWGSEASAKLLIDTAIKENKSPFSQMPTRMVDLNNNIQVLNFITAKNGSWTTGQALYKICPDIIENSREDEFKTLIYKDE